MARRRAVGIGFMILWLTFWTAAIFVAVWSMGRAALTGEPAAAVFLAVWLAAAGFGFVSGARRLRALLLKQPQVRPPSRNHRWNDGVDDPAPARDAPAGTAPPPPPPPDR